MSERDRLHLLNRNLKTPASAKVLSVRLDPDVLDEESDDFRPPRPEELDAIAMRRPKVRIRGLDGQVVEHLAPDGKAFRVRDLLAAIEETERQGRGSSDWFGGVDVHHVFFQGLHPDEQEADVWQIDWAREAAAETARGPENSQEIETPRTPRDDAVVEVRRKPHFQPF